MKISLIIDLEISQTLPDFLLFANLLKTIEFWDHLLNTLSL
jgi:hypothetical protein